MSGQARTEAVPSERHRTGARGVLSHPWSAAIVVFAWWLLSLRASWPGWMAPDSWSIWIQAASGQYNDWHAVVPTWIWDLLGPVRFGPVGPLVLQYTSFWAGFLLFMVWAQRRSTAAAWVSFLLVIVSTFVWNLAWILSDGWILGALSLATGLLLVASDLEGRPARSLLVLAGLITGAAGLARPYMTPFLILWGVAVWALVSGRSRRTYAVYVMMALLVALIGVGIGRALDPIRSYTPSATMLLDLARIECASRPVQSTTPARGEIPREFIVAPGAADICGVFAFASSWNPMIWNEGETKVRMPLNDAEYSTLIRAWLTNALEQPSMVLSGKIEAFSLFNTADGAGFAFPTLSGAKTRPGGMSINESQPPEVQFPSSGGLPLALAALPANLFRGIAPGLTSGIFLLVLVPLSAFGLLVHRHKERGLLLRAGLLVAMPSLYVAAFALVAPATDARYVAPAQLMGLLAAGIISSVRALPHPGPPDRAG